jgi:predicted ATPase
MTGSISAFAIPATLHDSLMARLDRLVTAKAVAQYAAVLGRHFSYALLQAVSQLDEPTLQRELGRLVDAELLYQRGLPPQATYLFKHALIRDIAYESLLRSTRQGYHQRIAHILEEQFLETAEAQPELLAYHCTEAGLNEQAVRYGQKAGQRAIERSAHAEAIRHLTSALELRRLLPETLEWRRRECEIQTALGAVYIAAQGWGTSNMERAYMRALELGRQMDDPSTLFPIVIGLLAIYQVRADYYQAQQQGEELLRLAPRVHDPYALPAAHQLLGEPLMYQGQLAAAHAHYAHVLTSLNPASPRPAWLWFDLQIIALSHQTLTFWLLGYPMQALQRSQEARVAAQELAHPWTSGYGVLLLATCLFYYCYQDSAKVLEGAEALIALADEQGFAALRILGSCWRGWALAQAGQSEEGVAQLREGMAAWQVLGGGFLRSIFLGLLAEVYGRTGQGEKGLGVLAEALTLVDTAGERWYEAELHRLKGALWLSQSAEKSAAAEACFQHAMTIAQSQGAKAWELRTATSLARLWQQQGKRQEARELLAPIYDWFTEGFDTADLQAAKALLEALA